MTPSQAMRDGILAMLNDAADDAIWDDCLALYEFENEGDIVTDAPSIVSCPSLIGSTRVGVDVDSTRVTGKVDYARNFANTSPNVPFVIDSSGGGAGLPSLSGDFTFSTWVRLTGTYGGGVEAEIVLWQVGSGVGSIKFQVNLSDEDVATLSVNESGGAGPLSETTTFPTTGEWTHYALTRLSGTFRAYKNGVLVGSPVFPTANGNLTNDAMVFASASLSAGTWNLAVDQAAVWSRALSAGEISTLYASGAGYPYVPRALTPVPFLEPVSSGPFTANEDPLTVLERMSAVGARFPGAFLSKFPIDVSAPDESARSSPGRQIGYNANWLLVAIFPTMRDTDAAVSREHEVFEWRHKVKLALESRFVEGVPATPALWEFRHAVFGAFSGVWLPEAYVDMLPFTVRADGSCRTDV